MPTPEDLNIFRLSTRKSAVAKLTARVIVIFPAIYDQPQIQAVTRLHHDGDRTNV